VLRGSAHGAIGGRHFSIQKRSLLCTGEGLLAGWILSATDTVEGAIEGFFQVAQDVRGEVFQGTVKAIELVEEFQFGGARLMKGSAARISQFTQKSLAHVEAGSIGLVRVIRDAA